MSAYRISIKSFLPTKNVAGLTEGATVIKDIPQVADVENHFVKQARLAVEEKMDDFEFSVEDL
jgi:hypothetical protein